MKKLLLICALLVGAMSPISTAEAGGGCGFDTPRISKDVVKPGDSFDLTIEYVMYDVSPTLYQDPNYVPYVTFSNSIPWLSKTSQLLDVNSNGATYKASFQVSSDYKGNMQLQAIVFNICGSPGNSGTYGPRVIIQSDPSISTCRIDSVKVSDYSVDVGESFKVAFNVYSDLANIQPVVELTEYKQVTSYPTRLVGTSNSNSLRTFEATVNYKQARQYNYGAIARPEVKNMCNASGDREVIGAMGYITSMAMMKAITKGAECNNGSQPVSALDYLGVAEKLICTNYPAGSIRYSWRTQDNATEESPQLEQNVPSAKLCTREGVIVTSSQKYICVDTGKGLSLLLEKDATKMIFAKKEMTRILSRFSELRSQLKSAGNEAKTAELKLSIGSTIAEVASLDNFYRVMSPIPFDYVSANIKLASVETKVAELVKLTSIKQSFVSCTNGKSLLKVTGKNPKCPAGYKKKA